MHPDRQSKSGSWFAIVPALIALAGTAVVGTFSYSAGKTKAVNEAALAFSFPKEQFNIRVEEYSKLLKLLEPISTHAEELLTPGSVQPIMRKLNVWYYDRGGLIADHQTRALVYKLIQACDNWKDGPKPQEIHMLKNTIVCSCRSDLGIVCDANIDQITSETLKERVDRRDDAVRRLHRRASLVDDGE